MLEDIKLTEDIWRHAIFSLAVGGVVYSIKSSKSILSRAFSAQTRHVTPISILAVNKKFSIFSPTRLFTRLTFWLSEVSCYKRLSASVVTCAGEVKSVETTRDVLDGAEVCLVFLGATFARDPHELLKMSNKKLWACKRQNEFAPVSPRYSGLSRYGF
jgi:hypothetical protein